MGDQDRYFHLKEVSVNVNFITKRPSSDLELVFEDEVGVKHSRKFKRGSLLYWNIDTYVQIHTRARLTIQRALLKISVAQIEIEFKPNDFEDYSSVKFEDRNHRVAVNFVCGRSKYLDDITHVYGSQARTATINRLNDEVLLDIFDCCRLDEKHIWNERHWWCKLPHVCQRWRHLLYKCAYRLGMYIKCTNLNGTRIVDMLEQLQPLPLFINYGQPRHITAPTKQEEFGIYHAIQSHDRVRHIDLELPPSILHRVFVPCFVLPDEEFPIVERLSISLRTTSENILPLTLPDTFLAPNLRHLALPSIRPPRELQLLTSTVSLVTLVLSNIETSSYFHPRQLVTRLQSLPLLKELSLGFSTPTPRPSAERELIGEQGAPGTLPSLKILQFKGASRYLESLVAQFRAPRLELLWISLFNEIAFVRSYQSAFALPHFSHLINITEAFKLPSANVFFDRKEVYITKVHHISLRFDKRPFLLRVMCDQLNSQIKCASQICRSLTLALSGVEKLTLYRISWRIELRDGVIDSATAWHDLLRSFIAVKELYINDWLMEDLAHALQADGVGLDLRFLPNLRSLHALDNRFTSFIDARQAVGRPVQFSQWR